MQNLFDFKFIDMDFKKSHKDHGKMCKMGILKVGTNEKKGGQKVV
jgi:hypothetical protein